MSEMKLIMEGWRRFIEDQVSTNALNEIDDSPIYFFNETLDGKNLIEEKIKPIKQMPLREVLQDMENDVIPLKEAMNICIDSLIYEHKIMLDEGLLDFIKSSWGAVKKGSQKAIAKAREVVAKLHEKWIEWNVKVHRVIVAALGKTIKIFVSGITGATKAAEGVMTAVLKLSGIKDPTQKQVTKAMTGFLTVAAAVIVAYVVVSELGLAADGLNQIAEAAREGGSDAVANLCEGMDAKTKLLYENVCMELKDVSPEEIINTCMKELGSEDAINGAKKVLMDTAGGEGAGYWEYVEHIQSHNVVGGTEFAGTVDPATGIAGELITQQVDSLNVELLAETVEGVSKLATDTTQAVQSKFDKLVKASSSQEIKQILNICAEEEREILAKAIQAHARVVDAAPEVADQLEAIGSKIEVLGNHHIDSTSTHVHTNNVVTKGGQTVVKWSEDYQGHTEQVGKMYFTTTGVIPNP